VSAAAVDAVIAGGGGFIEATSSENSCDRDSPFDPVDVKPFSEWYQVTSDAENLQLDLSHIDACRVSQARAGSSISQPTWAVWASSRTTKPCAY
jgi:hypothetical protein